MAEAGDASDANAEAAPGLPAGTTAPDPDWQRSRRDIEREIYKAGLAAGLGDSRDLPLDSHMHTVYSPDAEPDALLDAYCALAVERGITELAITDHVDFDPLAPAYAF